MIYPEADKLENWGSKYALVTLAAKRAKQVRSGAPPMVDTQSRNPLTIALEEIAAGKVQCEVPDYDKVYTASSEPEVADLLAISTADLETEEADSEAEALSASVSEDEEIDIALEDEEEEEEEEDETDVWKAVMDGDHDEDALDQPASEEDPAAALDDLAGERPSKRKVATADDDVATDIDATAGEVEDEEEPDEEETKEEE